MRTSIRSSLFLLLAVSLSAKELPLNSLDTKGQLVLSQPAPFNLQGVASKNVVALSWEWQPPEAQPLLLDFGYEIWRADGGRHEVIGTTAWKDEKLEPGSYAYKVRVRGSAKEKGKRVIHVSAWSESATVEIKSACTGAPRVYLKAEPTQQKLSSVTSLRLRLKGQATVPERCTLERMSYQIDAGTGLSHTGTLKFNDKGLFDEIVDAIGPEDEIPTGEIRFTVTATAENEYGPATSDQTSLTLYIKNKFAPR